MLKYIAIAADFASVAGLFVTLAVFLGLRRIKSFYVFRARIPELATGLGENASRISVLLADFANSRDAIRFELAQMRVLARSIREKSTGESKREAKRLFEAIELALKQNEEEGVRNVYVQSHTLLTTLREMQLDLQWEK